jgi:hypothetical protein
MICPLCERELGASTDYHHLIPATFKGKETIALHRICHTKLHSIYTEREMLRYYHTVERLKENEEIKKFIKWVKKKYPDFYDHNKDTAERKRKRR